MKHSFVRVLAFCLTLAITSAHAGNGPGIVSATLRSVMVYRNGAEMVHTATVHLVQGNNDLIIDGVSNTIDANSIRIGCSGSVTIMSVAFSTDYLKTGPTSPIAKNLQDSIAVVKKELSRSEALISSVNGQIDLLNANKSIAGASSGVTVAELSKMLDYYRQKVLDLQTELGGYQEQSSLLKDRQFRLESQLKEELDKNTKTGGNLVLQLLSPLAGPCDLTISYLTTAAHWEPSYDLRVNKSTDPLHLLYKARLVQTSGIDWKQIRLSLSTSTPARSSNAPVLRTWFLRFSDPVADAMNSTAPLIGRVAGVSVSSVSSMSEAVVTGYSAVAKESREYTEPLYIVNGKEISAAEYNKIDRRAISNVQHLEGRQATDVYGARGGPGVYVATLKDELGDYVSVNDKTVDVVFDIDVPYDVPANGREQGVVLKDYQLKCSYQYFTAPRLDNEVYLLGQVPGWERLNLLPGEANLIVAGTFVGRSRLDPGSTQDTLNLTLGQDKRIVVHREKIAEFSSVKFLGSNKKEVLTYEITVRNNKQEKVELLLKDQYPISSNKDIEEELLESSGAVVDKDTGILTWKVELSAGEIKKFRLSYSIRYPKDKSLYIHP